MTNKNISRGVFARALAAFLATSTIVASTQSAAAPADIFSSPAPVVGSAPPKAAELRAGEASVSTQTGALTYSYSIAVPPGRGGMAPHLSLGYSSQAPIYGGIASGWSLSIPAILEDTSQGRLRTRADENDFGQPVLVQVDDDRYLSTMAGNRPLVRVDEPSTATGNTYRAQNDASYTRYERNFSQTAAAPYYWRALLTSGVVMTFGDPNRMGGCPYVGFDYAPLTGEVDAFGNEVKYVYEWNRQTGDCHIQEISWGMNAAAGLMQSFARVRFAWELSPEAVGGYAIGSSRSYRTGHLVVEGADQLMSITATAFLPGGATGVPEHTRQIRLSYDQIQQLPGALTHAPIRVLKSIQESAWGTNSLSSMPRVDLPPVEFTYAPQDTVRSPPVPTNVPWSLAAGAPFAGNLGWGYRRTRRPGLEEDRWPSVESILIDMDGDGLLDRLFSTSGNADSSGCSAEWQRNLGPDASGALHFSPPVGTHYNELKLPRLKWKGNAAKPDNSAPVREGCSLNGQVTAYTNSYPLAGICHDGSLCAPSSDPARGGQFCNPGGTQCPLGDGGGGTDGYYRTYLAYRWMDADGDGLTDLVAAVHGDIDSYDVGFGNNLGAGVEPVPFGMTAWPACPGQMEICEDIGGCMSKVAPDCSSGSCVPDWGALGKCFASHLDVGCSKLTGDMTSVPPGGPTLRAPYTRCEGLYPWFIFKNSGNGSLAATPTVKYQPVPLESDGGDSQIASAGVYSQDHAIFDLDGDGWPDAVAHGKTDPTGNPDGWYAWLGDGTGGLGPDRYFFPTRSNVDGKNRIYASDDNITGQQKVGVLDFNGDGLPDHWLDMGNGVANIAFHDGTKFEVTGPALEGATNTPSGAIPRNVVVPTSAQVEFPGGPVKSGTVTATSRPIDVDNDGRVDLVQTTGSTSSVFYNVGGQLTSPGAPYPGNSTGITRTVIASETAFGAEDRIWEVKDDLLDLDGDGIAEGLSVSGGTLSRAMPAPTPPRLMTSIKNNHGLVSTISYASMHSPAVTQSPAATWWDGHPKATPVTQWVVSSIRVDDAFDTFPDTGPGATTTYQYFNPRHGEDDTGHYAFRGFETVVTTGPSQAKTTQTYGYDIDWSGRLVKTTVASAEQPGSVATVDTTKYQRFSLFGGALTTFHPVQGDHFTCADNQTESQCMASPAALNDSVSTFQPKFSDISTTGEPARMWIETTTRTRHALTNADGDRVVTSSPILAANASIYRLRPGNTINQHQVAGSLVTFARSATTWDKTNNPIYARKLTDEVWVDSDDNHRSITRYDYDVATGNLLSTTSPRGYTTSYEYDSRALLVAFENSPLFGHNIELIHEYGTGATIETRGPNIAPCATPPMPAGSCASSSTSRTKQTSSVRLDGLGRMLERWESVTAGSGSLAYYDLRKVDAKVYVDTIGGPPATPPSVTHDSALKESAGVITYLRDKTEFDGHGRPIKVTKYAQGAANANHVTSYVYRLDGSLQSVLVPHPTANDATQVAYTYTFDSLGRATGIARPDAAHTGVAIAYSGLTTTSTEMNGGSGKAAVTRRTVDADGRLSKVEEMDITNGTTSWPTTRYLYGPDNNVTQITDPENKVTTLAHDQAGHRTAVNRYGRVWQYTYDADGNVASEITPSAATCSPQPTCRDLFTTVMVYDPLDRLSMKYLARRGLSDADLTLFGALQESYSYDANGFGNGPNARGHLARWQSLGIGGGFAQTQLFSYDVQGRALADSMSFNAAGFSLARNVQQSYLLSGLPLRTFYDPMATGGLSEMTYDLRGLPQSVAISTNGGTSFQPAIVDTRNVAGLVTTRKVTYPSGSPMTAAQSAWTYDLLGRVTEQSVTRLPAADPQVARQQLAYLGNDDLSSLTTWFASTAKLQTFDYDYRHQLIDAVATPSSAFRGTYIYGPAGRFQRATVTQTTPPSSTEVKPRDVFYNYADTDPELVTSLNTGSPTGALYRKYTYSPEGNQLTSSESSTLDTVTYLYDGNDRLRRATKRRDATLLGSEEYWYDASGSRSHVVKRNASNAVTEMIWYQGPTETHYTLSGPFAVQGHSYWHVSNGEVVARIDLAPNGTAATEYQFHGLANSTLAAVSSTGTINATFNYAPFGELIESTNAGGATAGTAVHNRRFNDEVQDALTSLSYYGARYYDRTLMGWTQVDPLYLRIPDLGMGSTPRRSNVASFVLNNPVRYVDPDGTDSSSNLSHWTDSLNADRAQRVALEGAGYVDKGSCAWNSQLKCFRGRTYAQAAAEGRARAERVLGRRIHNLRVTFSGKTVLAPSWRELVFEATGRDLGPSYADGVLYAGLVAFDWATTGWALDFAYGTYDHFFGDGGEEEDPEDVLFNSVPPGGTTPIGGVGSSPHAQPGGGGGGGGRRYSAFASQRKLDEHFSKHAAEWGAGNITKQGYVKRAQSLLTAPVGGNIAEKVRGGDILRYNLRTNEFAVGSSTGSIRTLFRPTRGLLYWLDQ